MSGKYNSRSKYINTVIVILAVVGLCSGGYFYYLAVQDISKNTADLEGRILESESKNIVLAGTLLKEQQKNETFAIQIGQIAGTVSRLDQLSKTDRELLQKYSKVYFLNENYVPEDLTDIPPDYLYEKDKETKIHTKVLPYLEDLIVAGKDDDVDLRIISAYRSFGKQSALKGNYSVIYGSGANKFSADQGYSEHQLGTAIDFTTAKLGAGFTDFGDTLAYKWLLDNAYKYGFILSYPEGNAYYQFEPWHWRFVGKALAKMLHEENKNFYDVDQRTIDNYLINIFD